MAETTPMKFLSAGNLPSLIAKIKAQIELSETAAKTFVSEEIAKIPSVGNALAEAKLYTDGKIAALVGEGTPEALNTLREIAAAINDDADIAGTLTMKITANETAITVVSDDLSELSGTVDTKADKSTVNGISSDVSGLLTTVSGLQVTVADKAEKSVVNALATTVEGKAEKSAVEELSTAVSGLQTSVSGKADASALASLSAKAFTSDNMVELTNAEVDALVTAAFA